MHVSRLQTLTYILVVFCMVSCILQAMWKKRKKNETHCFIHHHPVKKLALVYHSAFINELEGKLGVFANCNRFINHFKHALQTKA